MKISHNSFKKRVKAFRQTFLSLGIEAFLVENPTDILYFTGLKMSRGKLLISERSSILCVDGRYKEMAAQNSPFPVRSIEQKAFLKIWQSNGWKSISTIGFDTAISFAQYQSLKRFFSKLKKRVKPCVMPIQKLRAIKDTVELRFLKKSAALLWEGFSYLQGQLKVGVTESELAYKFEFYCKQHGAEALSFDPIIAFGSNTALPHYHTGRKKLKKGDAVLVDIGIVLNGYSSDMTRMIFFGEVSKRIQELSKIVKLAHIEVLKACKPGVEIAELDLMARKVMGKEEKHFLHSLGHGIGLDVHEYPLISKKTANVKLEAGMVVTIEPGLYVPGVGGVRYEDMIVITKTGHQNLFMSA